MIAYDYEYNRAYMPSAPFVDITLSTLDETPQQIELSAQVDSASDASGVPVRLLRQIGARRSHRQQMRGITGTSVRVDLYKVQIKLAGQTFRVDVIGFTGEDTVIIGRDILNYLTVTLDGLSLTTIIPVND